MNGRFLFRIVLICCINFLTAHPLFAAPISHVQKHSYKSEEGVVVLEFPFLLPEDSIAAGKINNFLHLAILEIAPPLHGVNLEVLPLPSDAEMARNYSMVSSSGINFINEGRVVAVGLSTRMHGNWQERSSSYDFDAKTGRLLLKEELLTSQGRDRISQKLMLQRVIKVKNEIIRLNKLIKSGAASLKKSGDAQEVIKSKVDFYENCLAENNSNKVESAFRNIGIMNVVPTGLKFSLAPCGGSGLNDVGEIETVLSLNEISPYLSRYGKYIFEGVGVPDIDAVNPYAQVFEGTIGKNLQVVFYIGSSVPLAAPNSLIARYFYKKYGKIVPLSIQKNGDNFELIEVNSSESTKPVLRLRRSGTKLVGTWQGGKRTLDVELVP